MDSADMSSNAQRCNRLHGHEPVQAGALNMADQEAHNTEIAKVREQIVQAKADLAAEKDRMAQSGPLWMHKLTGLCWIRARRTKS